MNRDLADCMDLTNRAVLITGGRRIGRAVAEELARRGAHLCLSHRRTPGDLERTAETARAMGRTVILARADLADETECSRLVEETVRGLGRLDILIHMASLYESKPFDEMNGHDWDRGLAVDARAAFLCARAAVPHMRAVGGGRIVLLSDWLPASGRPRYRGYLSYYVAKAAVIGLTEALALELAADNILVNAVAPGPIRPPDTVDADEIEKVGKVTPLGHWGGDQEVVKAVVALIDADFVTGETIRVDGGRHLQ